ncbi:MAG: hypothetical protein U0359_36270 [Byssovorax sp.]
MRRAKQAGAAVRAPERDDVEPIREGAVVRHLAPVAPPQSTQAAPSPAAQPALPSLVALTIVALDAEARVATLLVGGTPVAAALDPSLDVAVLRTAVLRRERVIAQQEASPGGDADAGWVILGVLRTAATPGVDEGDEFLIKARRVTVVAANELAFVTGAASLVLRAYGHIESIGQDITSRAASVHKIIGRMIRLN